MEYFTSFMVRFENIEHKLDELRSKLDNIESKLNQFHYLPDTNTIIPSDISSITFHRVYNSIYGSSINQILTHSEFHIMGDKEITEDEYNENNLSHSKKEYINGGPGSDPVSYIRFFKKIKNMTIYMTNDSITAESLVPLAALEKITLANSHLIHDFPQLANIPTLAEIVILNHSHYSFQDLKQMIPQLKIAQIGAQIMRY
jgi:hypothetical protein